MSKAVELTQENFEEEVLKSDKPVLVDFWAPWCGPCKMMAPELDAMAGEQTDVKIAKLNVDTPEHQELAQKYQISSIPNLKLFKAGEVIGNYVGYRPKAELKKEIDASLA